MLKDSLISGSINLDIDSDDGPRLPNEKEEINKSMSMAWDYYMRESPEPLPDKIKNVINTRKF